MIRNVLIVRSAFSDIYEPAWRDALRANGVEASVFDTHCHIPRSVWGRIQQRFLAGPHISAVNRLILEQIRGERPDVTLFYQGHHFWPRTIAEASKYSTVVGYHNDDFLGPRKHMLRYRHLRKGLRCYHGYHVYRDVNKREMRSLGLKNCETLHSYYVPDRDFPRQLDATERARFGCDLIFAGHAENDFRGECLAGAGSAGLDVRVFGFPRAWKKFASAEQRARFLLSNTLQGKDYRKALCGAKIAACFLSKWNRDLYTRRVFEIPACGVFLLCERTPVMQELYEEGKEAEFFSSVEEFVDKAVFYAREESARKRISQAGYHRCTTSGYDIRSRMRQWLEDVHRWIGGVPSQPMHESVHV